MASNERRRERYRVDDEYRRARIQQSWDRRNAERMAKERERRLRGWKTIDSVPDNEVVLLYDPDVFWPVHGSWGGVEWDCIHYVGPPLRPTYWRPVVPLPLT